MPTDKQRLDFMASCSIADGQLITDEQFRLCMEYDLTHEEAIRKAIDSLIKAQAKQAEEGSDERT